MGDSLREQLLRSGLAKPGRRRNAARQGSGRALPPKRPAGKSDARCGKADADPGSAADIDLARAWALRKRAESAERQRAKAAADAEARARKQRLQRLRQVLRGNALNLADGDRVRHFEYGGRIRRVHVDAAQLAALNAGHLGVVQHKGSYVLVARAVAEQVRRFAPTHVALLVDPDADAPDDGVPDELTW